jgi:glucokinase
MRSPPTNAVVAGVDLGGSHVSAALAARSGEIIVRASEPVDRHAGPETLLAQIVALVRRLRDGPQAEGGAAGWDLLRLAIGCPGIIDHSKGVVLGAANLDGWRRVPVRATLEGALGVPVRLENDVNLGALGEGWQGAARGMSDYVFIALGTGVGGGVVVNGQLVRGAHGFGGEVGYLIVEPALLNPEFRDHGNLEALVGAPALERMAAEQGIDGGTASLFAAAAAGHPGANRLVDATVRRLAAAIAGIAAVLDPQAVIVGGGLSLQGDALFDPLRRLVGQIAGPPVTILPAALGTDAQLYGAIYAALDQDE